MEENRTSSPITDEECERWIQDDEARNDPAVFHARCTVCGSNWVDVMNGEDTCPDCLVTA